MTNDEQINYPLDPCKSCGAFGRISQTSAGKLMVACNGCGMQTRGHSTARSAALTWNRRPSDGSTTDIEVRMLMHQNEPNAALHNSSNIGIV